MPAYRDKTSWYLGLSAYWFATSFKWFVIFLLMGLHVANIVPEGEKNSWWGLVVAIGAAEAMIGPAFFGYFSDKLAARLGHRRPFITIGAAITALALLLIASANSIGFLVAAYLLLQISDDIAQGPYSALIPELVPTDHRGRASGMMGLLNLLAQVFAAVVAFVLGNIFLIFVATAVINILCAVIVLLTVRGAEPLPRGPSSTAVATGSGFGMFLSRLFSPFRDADFRWSWFTRFLNQLGFYLILLYVANYLKDRVQVFDFFGLLQLKDPKEAALVIAVGLSLTGAFAALNAGKLADKIGRKKIIKFAGLLMFAVLVPFALIPNYGVIVLLALLFGIGYGAYQSANWALAADVLPNSEDTGKDMGIWQASIAAPQVFSGAAGLLVDAGNRMFGKGMGYSATFLLASLCFLASTQLIVKVRGST